MPHPGLRATAGGWGRRAVDEDASRRLGALELEHVRSFRETVARQCEALVDRLVDEYAAAVEGLRGGPLQPPSRRRPSLRQEGSSPVVVRRTSSRTSQGPQEGSAPSAVAVVRRTSSRTSRAPQEGPASPPLPAAVVRRTSSRPSACEQPRELQQQPPQREAEAEAEPEPSSGAAGSAAGPQRPSLQREPPVAPPQPSYGMRRSQPDSQVSGEAVALVPSRQPRMHSVQSGFRSEGDSSASPANSRRAARKNSFTSESSAMLRHKRLVLFTDMSPECDDECALLYLLSDLNNKEDNVTIELIMADAEIRFRWMEYLFSDKFANHKWRLGDGSVSFKAGTVQVNMFLLQSPNREAMVTEDFKKKAPSVSSEPQGKCLLKFLGHSAVAAGPADAILISAPVPDLDPGFFGRFLDVKGVYVVGTPGGVNCQQPSWSGLLYALHQLAPVIYLSPQFTRLVRFPKAYVEANPHWTAYMKRTIFDMALTCMARRPEIPAKFGDWGLVLRLNAANAKLCQDWFEDVMGTSVEDVGECPANIKPAVDAYVERNSGADRKIGGVVAELRLLGIASRANLDEHGQPRTPEDFQTLREEYRRQLFQCVYACVLTTESLIFQNASNFETTHVSDMFSTVRAKSGYTAPLQSLAMIFGADEAIHTLKALPIQALTPAYDMVGAICVLDLLESGKFDGLGLNLEVADEALGRGLFTPEHQREDASPHGIWLVGEQEDSVIEEVADLLRSQIDSDPMLIMDEFWSQWQSTAHLTRKQTYHDGFQAAMLSSASEATYDEELALDRYMSACVLHPASTWRILWSILGFFLILYDCVTVPLQAFGLEQVWAMGVVAATFWSADMLQSFSVGYYQGGMIEMRLHRTIRRYLRTWFSTDVVMVATSWVVALHPDADNILTTKLLRMVWLLRLLKVSRLAATTKALSDAVGSRTAGHVLEVLQMVVLMCGVVHIVACGWYAIAVQFESAPTWVEHSEMADADIVYIYVSCLQWSFLNLLFTPLESIAPTTTLERCYSLAIQAGGLMIFSTLLSSLTGFMARLAENRAEQSRVDEKVRQYFEDRHLSAALVGQIESYRRDALTHSARRKLPREQVPGLEELPESLAVKLSYEIFAPELCKHGFFHLFHEARQNDMAVSVHRMMKEVFLLPSNEVFFKDQVAHHFYTVREGSLAYLMQGSEQPAEAGQWISELALWVDSWRRKGSLVSSTPSMLHSLSIAEFHGCALELRQLGRMGCRFAELVARGIQRSEVPFVDLHDLWMDLDERNSTAQRVSWE